MTRERKRLTGAPLRASVKREGQRGPSTRSFSATAKTHALEALEALASLAQSASSEAVRVSAANAVLDRAYGKPASGTKAPAGAASSGQGGTMEVRWLGDEES